jgi:hypothetical protein
LLAAHDRACGMLHLSLASLRPSCISSLCSNFSSFFPRSHGCVMDHKPAILTRRRRSYSFRRLPRSSTFKILLLLFFLWDSIHCISLYLLQTAALQTSPPPPSTKRIYIAAQHYNSARLLREHWNEALYNLVKELGIENVFVSIYESGSYDETQDALREEGSSTITFDARRGNRVATYGPWLDRHTSRGPRASAHTFPVEHSQQGV